ncbi:MAG TPA: CsgG/HfaB family protein [Thermoanaerobaculaceae bacterium]|nr:CsgG/HfaB family protein [Thermoanaerobaculaceae bacterium]
MRRQLRVLASTILAVALPAVAAAQTGGLRYSITVSKFENKAGWAGQWDIGDAWGTILTDLLNQTGKFIVLGEKDMRQEAMGEQDFAASGRAAGGAKAPVTGQMTPAQLLVKGAITHVQDSTAGGHGGIAIGGVRLGGGGGKGEVNATIYVVDSTTGQVLASKSVTGVSTRKGLDIGYSGSGFSADAGGYQKDNVGKAVTAACKDAVDFLIQQLPKIPWSGTVAQVAGGKVYVNRGSREGVSAGQVFVVGEANVVRDPDTGEVLDSSVKEIAKLQVSQVKEKLSICTVTSGNAAAVKRGMMVTAPSGS